ncbi:carbohydrate esterase family 15 protein [Phanerochaete carnosa HHB-10118-sp]|uniref:(4-O-methyl)-D-glucuronate--lignin esterase n=1 Tax=Phanerochaete carnosa (strain HHB-10118-sp) TaxID=650164 RepID=K5VRQ7_PHACS|nr:carbohydrate esterase family 15 protein [Phanerochaete carnosa HHB-10118-sp]EKM49259.1 carbohydrate esterase family 15 protein [Phanerochaete carnosa HHB-10118-sp]
MKSATYLATLIAVLPAYVNAQAQEWRQCGGIGWARATTCISGTVCTVLNPYYSQCLPGTATTVVPPPPSTTVLSLTSSALSTGPTGTSSMMCSVASTISGFNNVELLNPFIFNDGTPMQTKDDFTCRQQQISALIQGYEAGALRSPPQSISAPFSKSGSTGTLSITVTNAGQSISFALTISFLSGTLLANGWPLVIAFEGSSIPIPADDMAQQTDTTSRGKGLFYNLYNSNVSRIIDALKQTPSAQINTQCLAVTGCSHDGKSTLMAGVLKLCIALTILQESGSGGDTCWWLSKYESDTGNNVQTATEIVTENIWFSTNFANYVNNLPVLSYDYHMLMGLVAPRALVSFENTDYNWLLPMSAWGCVTATHTIFSALGVSDNYSFAQIGGHAHCAWLSSLMPNLNAFFNKFLLDQNVNTSVFLTNNQFGGAQWMQSNWINWTTPTLT